jgi:hypothetical protein
VSTRPVDMRRFSTEKRGTKPSKIGATNHQWCTAIHIVFPQEGTTG